MTSACPPPRLLPLLEPLEPRLLLSTSWPSIPGLHPVAPEPGSLHGQVVYIDFDGAKNVDYNGPVTVKGVDVPAFSAARAGLAGHEGEIKSQVLSSLRETFADSGIAFTLSKPTDGTAFSTVFVGGDGAAFHRYGSFCGLAEKIDVGNRDSSDCAFVFSDAMSSGQSDLSILALSLTSTVAHETGHLLGYAHVDGAADAGTLRALAAPTISIDDVTKNEGNTGTTPFVFTVSLSSSWSQTITVKYTCNDKTATAPGDYTTTAGTLTFNPGVTTRQITVPVIGDSAVEPDETFEVYLYNATIATIDDNKGTGTILNDDVPSKPTISIGDVAQDEGSGGGATTFNFHVTLSNSYNQTVTVHYTCNDVTALSPSDYTTASGTLTFDAGETDQTIPIQVVADASYEPDETFQVVLSNSTNSTISDNTGVGTIVNDDPRDGTVTISGTATYFDGGAGTQTYRPIRYAKVQIIDASGNPVAGSMTETNSSGAYSISFTATNGARYGLEVLAKADEGEVRNQFDVADSYDSPKQAVTVNSTYTINADIDDDNWAAAWNILDSIIRARDFLVGGGYMTAGQIDGLVVRWYPGATDGTHYHRDLDEIHIADSDGLQYADSVILHEYGHYVEDKAGFGGASPGGLHYINKKVGYAQPSLTQVQRDTLSFNEGWASFFASSVLYANGVTDGNDVRVGDVYGSISGSLVVVKPESGQVWTKSGTIQQVAAYSDVTGSESELAVWGVLWDLFDQDSDELFPDDAIWADSVISNPAGKPAGWATDPYSVPLSWGTVWNVVKGSAASTSGAFWDAWSNPSIDPGSWSTRSAHLEESQRVLVSRGIPAPMQPTISINDVSQAEGNSGTTNFLFIVSLSNAYNQPVTVQYTFNDVTAIAPGDYTGTPGTLTFAAGETSKTITVPVVGDTTVEPDETFEVLLYNSSNSTISDNKGVGTIINDEDLWTGTVSNHWENAANWWSGIVPGLQTQVRISGAAARQPVLYQNQTVWGLDLGSGAVCAFAPGAAKTLMTKSLSIAESGGAPTARLDLASGRLIVDYDGAASPLASIKRWLAAGYNTMRWMGSGIASSAAAPDPITYGLGYAQNNMLFLPYDVFSGVPVDLSTILVKFTYNGDVNLDGCVDDNDVTFINLFYDGGITTSHYWNEGDIWGYDGRVDDNDVTILGLTYGLGIGSPLGGAGPTGVGLEAPAAAKLPPAAARAPSALTLGAMGSAPDAVALAIAMGIPPDPTSAATADPADSPSASGDEALLAEAAAPGQDANAARPSAARDLASPAPPLVWRSADQGTPVAAAEGAALDLLLLPALDVLCRA